MKLKKVSTLGLTDKRTTFLFILMNKLIAFLFDTFLASFLKLVIFSSQQMCFNTKKFFHGNNFFSAIVIFTNIRSDHFTRVTIRATVTNEKWFPPPTTSWPA